MARMDLRSPQLIEATRIWTGWGSAAWPQRDDAQVVARFGATLAAALLAAIRLLEADFYASDARHVAADLREMGELASAHFRQRHPEAAEEIVEMLAWCYTFDFK